MRAKSFFYASAGVFLLVAAYTLGARHAVADLNHASGSHVIGFSGSSGTTSAMAALRSDGTVFSRDGIGGEWRQVPVGLPPVPIEDVIFWDGIGYQSGQSCLTKDGYAWAWTSSTGWVRSADAIPTPPIAVQGKTWSGVKQGYRAK